MRLAGEDDDYQPVDGDDEEEEEEEATSRRRRANDEHDDDDNDDNEQEVATTSPDDNDDDGEDLLESLERDYQHIPEPDTYGTEGVDDQDYDVMTAFMALSCGGMTTATLDRVYAIETSEYELIQNFQRLFCTLSSCFFGCFVSFTAHSESLLFWISTTL